MKKMTTSGLRCGLLALAALSLACSSSTPPSTTGGSSTTGATTTGGTTGVACFGQGVACPNGTNCCVGLACNTANFCEKAATSGGTTTGGGNPCPISDVGGPCGTSQDCTAGLFCVDGGCIQPDTTAPNCTADGTGASAGFPCCETNAAGACVAWQSCITQGQSCSDGGTCCNNTTCGADGTCDPVCLGIGQACTQDSDCCSGEGFLCADGSLFAPPLAGKICAPIGLTSQAVPNNPSSHYYCDGIEPLCAAAHPQAGLIECQLDAVCNPADGGNPCATDGLICDQNYIVCRNPGLFDLCDLGGPPCTDFGDTTSPMVCSAAIFGQVGGLSICSFSCTSTQDCVEPFMTCLTQQAADVCTSNLVNDPNQVGGPTCTYNGTCDAQGVADGVCLALGSSPGNPQVGLCVQAATDGSGGPGATCSGNGNRQNGGLCDIHDICTGNVCNPLCNAGTGGGVRGGCGTGLDCVPLLSVGGIGTGTNPTVDSDSAGACVTSCDLTFADAGACGMSTDGVSTKCFPAEAFGYAVGEVADFCVAGPGARALPVGADCSKAVFGNAVDPCVDGAACFGGGGLPSVCRQLCEDGQIGNKGVSGGCPVGFECNALSFTNTASTHTGECEPIPDGG